LSKLPDLPQGELEVMEVVWRKGEATVKDVHQELNKKRKLAYKTIGTLMMRLRNRGYVEYTELKYAHLFRPLVARDQVVRKKVDDLVNKVLGGDLAPLALYMVEHGADLTPLQIEALQGIVAGESEKDRC
jgi:BlaI family transcriptional regulator, penicillinase repressor